MQVASSFMAVFLFASSAVQDKGLDDTPKPVSSWRFNAPGFTGGTIADRSGELDIRLAKGGLPFTNDSSPQALLLREDARRLRVAERADPSAILPSQEFSISAWVRMDTPGKWAGIFSAIQDNGNHERGWAAGIHADQFYLGLRTDGGKAITYLFSEHRVAPNRWHHLLATYDGITMRLYVDGILDAESTEQSGAILWPEATHITIGAYEDDDERHPLLGALHSVELFDVALEEPEAAEIHAHLAGTFPEPETPEAQLLQRESEEIVGWPMYRRDPQRSAACPEPLELPLDTSWTFSTTPPRPSWPEPAQRSYWQNLEEVVPRVVFDQANHPVCDGNVVVMGSSRDDHVRCLDLDTGSLLWEVATDGPIRFAPVIDGDGVIVASDDGHLRRLHLRDGTVAWKTRLAPEDRRIPGNGRLISTWPIRTGPVLESGLIHATSGLFPRFGTYAFAIEPATGEIVWKQPLPGISPQGYLLASPRRLFVPTGRTSPTMLGRGDGRSLGTFQLPGGTFALLIEDELISGPGSSGELAPANIHTRETAAGFRADRGIVVPELIILQRGDVLRVLDRKRLIDVRRSRTKLLASQVQLEAAVKSGKVDATDQLGRVRGALADNLVELEECELWQTTIEGRSLALAGNQLILGSNDGVVIFDAKSGTPLWQGSIKGSAVGLAVAGGRLLVASDRGALHVFGPGTPLEDATRLTSPINTQATTYLSEDVLLKIQHAGMDRGIAIVVDPVDGEIAFELAARTTLHVAVLDKNPLLIANIRKQALARNLYGDRVVAHVIAPENAPFIDGIANLLVSEAGLRKSRTVGLAPEVTRLLRPAGGLLLGADISGVTEEIQLRPAEDFACSAWLRDPLPGAADWTHPYANPANTAASNEQRLGGPNLLQWFGGPGPARMVDRHLRTTAPLAQGGRMFIPANDSIVAVDAYNGIELWDTQLPGFSRTGAPYDGGWWAVNSEGIFAATLNKVVQIDVKNGSIIRRYPVPPVSGIDGPTEWGWLALDNGLLLGSAAIEGTSRREQSRDAVVEQYAEARPLATSRALFAVDPETGKTLWIYQGGPIPHSAIATSSGRIFFLESLTGTPKIGRLDLPTLNEQGFQLVALDIATGEEVWREALGKKTWKHSVYLSCTPDAVVLVGAHNSENQNRYTIDVHDSATGKRQWHAEHDNNREGIGGDHGEQVHHPLIMGDLLVAEPLAYDMASGIPVDPTDRSGFSIKSRSGCGTISGSASCLFFRDGNPTMIELKSGKGAWEKLTHASRPGCWVNIIPAQGLVLLPESSAGCVCGFSLQTSMALTPKRRNEQ